MCMHMRRGQRERDSPGYLLFRKNYCFEHCSSGSNWKRLSRVPGMRNKLILGTLAYEHLVTELYQEIVCQLAI